jgi:hypothetical protein
VYLKPVEQAFYRITNSVFWAACVGIIIAIVIIIPVAVFFSLYTVKNDIQFRQPVV